MKEARLPDVRSLISRLDVWFLTCLLVVINIPMMRGRFSDNLVFFPGRAISTEWWRAITHPFVHVSWYHLLLDGSAFLMLYAGMKKDTMARRLASLLACGIGSLAAALIAETGLAESGLCGLSGIAHGLAVIAALEIAAAGDGFQDSAVGIGILAIVVGKCIIEAVSGTVVFSSLHLGTVGLPVAVCHAGGALGGAVFGLLAARLASVRRSMFGVRMCPASLPSA
jgi:rhomboid family GlyGly-CTERM serine protease